MKDTSQVKYVKGAMFHKSEIKLVRRGSGTSHAEKSFEVEESYQNHVLNELTTRLSRAMDLDMAHLKELLLPTNSLQIDLSILQSMNS